MPRLLRLKTTNGPRAIPVARVSQIAKVPEKSPLYEQGVRTIVISANDDRHQVLDKYEDVCRSFESDVPASDAEGPDAVKRWAPQRPSQTGLRRPPRPPE